MSRAYGAILRWWRNTVDIASASRTEDSGSNLARVYVLLRSHGNAVVLNRPNMNCLCVEKEKYERRWPKKIFF
jgi:hypothetical protein